MQNGTLGSLIYLLRMVIFHSKLLVYQRVEVTLIDIGPRKRPRRHHLASNPGAWRAGAAARNWFRGRLMGCTIHGLYMGI